MQHVEGLFFDAEIALGILDLEPGLARRAINLDQVGIEGQPCAIFLDVVHQRRDKGRHAEQRGTGQVEFNINSVQVTLFEPVVARQVHGLLRRTGAFDRHGRLGEDRLAALELLHQSPGVGRVLVAVVGGDAVVAQGLFQAFDFLPGQAQAGADDQVVPGHTLATVEHQGLFVGQQLADRRLHPGHTIGQHPGHGAHGFANVMGAAAHQGPGRLVVMVGAGFDQDEVQLRVALEQAGQQADARRAAADDHDIATDGRSPVLVVHSLGLCSSTMHTRVAAAWRHVPLTIDPLPRIVCFT